MSTWDHEKAVIFAGSCEVAWLYEVAWNHLQSRNLDSGQKSGKVRKCEKMINHAKSGPSRNRDPGVICIEMVANRESHSGPEKSISTWLWQPPFGLAGIGPGWRNRNFLSLFSFLSLHFISLGFGIHDVGVEEDHVLLSFVFPFFGRPDHFGSKRDKPSSRSRCSFIMTVSLSGRKRRNMTLSTWALQAQLLNSFEESREDRSRKRKHTEIFDLSCVCFWVVSFL